MSNRLQVKIAEKLDEDADNYIKLDEDQYKKWLDDDGGLAFDKEFYMKTLFDKYKQRQATK